jgi:hypothetical protein
LSSFFHHTGSNKKQRLDAAVVQAAERAYASVLGLSSVEYGNAGPNASRRR